MQTPEARALLRALFDAALQAADPAACLPPQLPAPPRGRTLVLGAGKAAGAMAAALQAHWPAQAPLSGLVVTRYGHVPPALLDRPGRIEVLQAAHPVPDEAGAQAAQRMLQLARGLSADDLVICLVSGGGSSLLAAPAPGLTLADKQALNRELLASGATISEMNCVRRHLSAIKGGRLALACAPARVCNLLISDVPGDDPVDIASGPTVADPSRCADALAVLQRHGIQAPSAALALLRSGAGETPKPGDARLPPIETRLVATPQQALEAAAAVARRAGIAAHILGDALEGEARAMGTVLAGIARQVAWRGQPFAPPCVLLSGGEATVQVRGSGRGGRNVESLLALTLALQGRAGVHALAADTDGVDGTATIAGALTGPDTLARAAALGLRAQDLLAANDAHRFFEALGDSLVTGPTLTNVNDFRAILVSAAPA
jgi:hydroxypyruvate reductase